MTTPIIDYWINRIQGRRWVAYKIPQHIIYYSRKGFKIASTGLFEILNERMAYYYYSLHFLNIRLKRVLPGFGKLIASTNKLLGIDNFFLKTPTGMSEIIMQKKMKDYLK